MPAPRTSVSLALGLALASGGLLVTPTPATANPAGTGLVINEVYGAGGNSGAVYKADFVEILNPTAQPVDLLGHYVTYRASTGTTGQSVALRGSVPAGGTYLVRMSDVGATGADLPTPDQVASPTIAMAAGGGQVLLTSNGQPVTAVGDFAGKAGVVDMAGLSSASSYEKASGPTATATQSAQRTAGADTNDNSADFTLGAPTPTAGGGGYTPVDAGAKSVAQVQGNSDTSPFVYDTVTTRGVVTAAYPTGGLNGFFMQTEGTGSGPDATEGADGIFVFGTQAMSIAPAVGDFVEVAGKVTEFNGLTQVTPGTGGATKINGEPHTDPVAQTVLPTTEGAREAHEGEVFDPATGFTVTNTFQLNNFGEVGLATGDTPLIAPTEVAEPQSAAAAAVAADNAARGFVLDDGSSSNYTSNPAAGTPSPWINETTSVRVGDSADLQSPVVLDFRNNVWKIQPQAQVTGLGGGVATFSNSRPENAAPQEVGGDLQLATFNVLNYFPTTGQEFVAMGGGNSCSYFNDRSGAPITVNSCNNNGPRGAATTASFLRQQAKTVTAIKGLDAEIISLEELENSAKYGKDRDFAIDNLVDALNASAGSEVWAYVPTPAAEDRPTVAQEDVIRTGFIYKPADVELVGTSEILVDEAHFGNAREPLAQAFKPAGTSDRRAFTVVVNHFKSKGSGVDDGTGQGNANPDRVAQAAALTTFAQEFATSRDTDAVFLAGDFNAYSKEDPIKVLEEAGYELIESDTEGEETYSFSGLVGSLDHVLGNAAAMDRTTGADVWNINSPESLAYQYGRYNNNVTPFFDPSTPFGASDHDPEIVGIRSATGSMDVQIIGTNDFHGRILNPTSSGVNNSSEAGAAVLSGAVKQLRAQNPNTVFAAAGDLIGASTFESFIQDDKPTIDALNEAGLDVSAVGNHEFDQGFADLKDRVIAPYHPDTNPLGGAEWKYLGANVKYKESGEDALEATWIKDMGAVEVGFIGAVTEDLPSLVNPSLIDQIQVTDIVEATNTAANDLVSEGADVVVLLVHEGAPGTTYESATNPANAFGQIVNGVNPNVDAIVSGHTHLAYNHSVPVPAWAGRTVTERPVVSAGQYGTKLNKLVFTVDRETGDVQAKTQSVLDLESCVAGCSGSSQTWQANYPSDPAVEPIVADAVADANVLGSQELGEVAGPFKRARLSAAVNGSDENRGGESTLGNLVAEVQRWATETPEAGSAQIAFMNPGGLRADMVGTVADGYPEVLTYRQAANVQPFANTLVNMQMTGVQIKTVLEQQWQRDGNGNIPSRPFLRLGASEGFTYTFDASRAEGDRITQMWLHGEEIDPTESYSVTVNSFLAAGGDNFRGFRDGSGARDTGKVDLQAMVDYMAANASESALEVDWTQRAVGVTFPAEAPDAYAAGEHVTFDLSSLAFTGVGDLQDSHVVVSLGDQELGTFEVNNAKGTEVFDNYGKASVDVVVPSGTPAGEAVLTVTGQDTGTTTTVPVQVAASGSTVDATATPDTVKVKKGTTDIDVAVTSDAVPTGEVVVLDGDTELGREPLVAGAATVTVGPFDSVGTKALTVRYLGDSATEASETTVDVTVVKRTPAVKVDHSPNRVVRDQTRAVLTADVLAGELLGTGTVTFKIGQDVLATKNLRGGSASVTLPKFGKVGEKTIKVLYSGDDYLEAVRKDYVLKVVRP